VKPAVVSFRLQRNPFTAGRAFWVIGVLFASLGMACLSAWLLSLLLGDEVLFYLVAALPVVSLGTLYFQREKQRREDAVPIDLRLDAGRLELSRGSATIASAPMHQVETSRCMYRAGGRTVSHFCAVQLELPNSAFAVALPDPRHAWPGGVPEATITPAYTVGAEAWPLLLDALGMERTSSVDLS